MLTVNILVFVGIVLFSVYCRLQARSEALVQVVRAADRRVRSRLTKAGALADREAILQRLDHLEEVVYNQLNGERMSRDPGVGGVRPPRAQWGGSPRVLGRGPWRWQAKGRGLLLVRQRPRPGDSSLIHSWVSRPHLPMMALSLHPLRTRGTSEQLLGPPQGRWCPQELWVAE